LQRAFGDGDQGDRSGGNKLDARRNGEALSVVGWTCGSHGQSGSASRPSSGNAVGTAIIRAARRLARRIDRLMNLGLDHLSRADAS
jgi:hypothetical protein